MQNRLKKHLDKVISVRDLNVQLDGHIILENINFDVHQGELVAVIGPNGAGKTTLIKSLLGLVRYSSGDIKILGKDIKSALNEISYVPQKFVFDKSFPITVKEFLYMSMKVVDEKRILHSIDELKLGSLLKHKIGDLSGGQMQRLLIARALLNDPKIIFLDEPTAGIDMGGAMSFYDIIEHQNKVHNITIVMISHEINMVYKYASQILCLNRDLICDGSPKDAITKEVLDKLYGEDTIMQQHNHF